MVYIVHFDEGEVAYKAVYDDVKDTLSVTACVLETKIVPMSKLELIEELRKRLATEYESVVEESIGDRVLLHIGLPYPIEDVDRLRAWMVLWNTLGDLS